MLVCLTGVSGNMGHATLKELVLYEKIDINPKANVANPSCNNNFLEILIKSIDFLSAIKYPETIKNMALPICPHGRNDRKYA